MSQEGKALLVKDECVTVEAIADMKIEGMRE